LGFMSAIFPSYAKAWKVDYASFRPVEEEGRVLSMRHRNDLLHVDAFPTRPSHGGRILRLFTNLHTTRGRVWVTSDSFEEIAEKYAKDAGLKKVTTPVAAMRRKAAKMVRAIGVKVPARSAYDEFMMGFHNYLKGSEAFQKEGRKHTWTFAPGQTWLCFTDQ